MFKKLFAACAALGLVAAVGVVSFSKDAGARPVYCSKGPAGWSCR